MNNIVLYDSSCNFCRNVKIFFKKIDFFNFFQWVSIENYKLQKSKYVDFDFKKLDSSFAVINSSNEVFFEFEACKYLVARIPFFWPILIFFYIPFISRFFGTIMYKKISHSRSCNLK